jgi:hypothetical protein
LAAQLGPLLVGGDGADGDLALNALAPSQQLVADAVAVECAVAFADDAGLVDGVLEQLAEVCFFHDDLAFVSVLPATVQ